MFIRYIWSPRYTYPDADDEYVILYTLSTLAPNSLTIHFHPPMIIDCLYIILNKPRVLVNYSANEAINRTTI